jgi:hypothetical protein
MLLFLGRKKSSDGWEPPEPCGSGGLFFIEKGFDYSGVSGFKWWIFWMLLMK